MGEGMSFSPSERERAQSSPQIKIQNFQGVIGDIKSANVSIGDRAAPSQLLDSAHLAPERKQELQRLVGDVESSPPDKRKGAIQRGLQWITEHGNELGALSNALRAWFLRAG